jgi:uncharacterized C2H2 Zn-finger protein
LANLTIKKIHCPKCEKLTRIKLQKVGDKVQFSCIKCSTLVWQKESYIWKYNKDV